MKRRVTEVFSIYDYVPDEQADKLLIIKDIKKRVDRKRRKFKGKDKEEVDELYSYLQVDTPITVEALPHWVKARMTDKKGAVGQFVIFRAAGRKANYEVAKELRTAFFDIKTPDGTAPTAAEYFILAAIIDAIKADAPMVIGLTLLVMFISAFVLVGNLRGPIVVFTVVGFAMVWLGGIMALFGWKLDMFNIIAIPLIVGMGQDDALHIFHRYEEGGPNAIKCRARNRRSHLPDYLDHVYRLWGIFFSNHRGLLSLAKISVVGLVLCFISSVIILPSILRLRSGIQTGQDSKVEKIEDTMLTYSTPPSMSREPQLDKPEQQCSITQRVESRPSQNVRTKMRGRQHKKPRSIRHTFQPFAIH